jgi:transketolase
MKQKIKQMRKNILKASYNSQAGHIPSAFSILEIVLSLYNNFINDNNVFALSKGHGCLALYSVFLEMGFISEEEFYSFCNYDSKLGGHPHKLKHPKIYASTGSLGHGLPICVGAALGKKIKGEKEKVYCLIGDGECNEGTTWESAMLASYQNLSNLVCIVDDNNSQIRAMPTLEIENKFKSFGWRVITVYDGNNYETITNSLKLADSHGDLPVCVVCKTVKGKGIKEMEDNMFAWHHGPPSKEQYDKFCEELDA